MICEKAYAKLNLTLSVLGKRNDGFHELKSLMVPISDLYDLLYFEENDSNSMVVEGCELVNNSIIKAAKFFQKKYKTKGAKIRLEKRIPFEAGLAGASADSSATLRGLNKLFNLNIPLAELEELAKELGSDNVFCLYNKAAVCYGRGEKLEFLDFDFEFEATLLKPKFGLLTKDVFSHLRVKGIETNQLEIVLSMLRNHEYKNLNDYLFNDLTEPAMILEPELKRIFETLLSNGVVSHMSGSGSTLYVVEKDIDLSNTDFEYVYFKKHLIKNSVND